MLIKIFDLPNYGAPICFCLVRVYSRAAELCLRVPSVIEGWGDGEFPPTYHRRSQLCNGIQQKPHSFVAFVIFLVLF